LIAGLPGTLAYSIYMEPAKESSSGEKKVSTAGILRHERSGRVVGLDPVRQESRAERQGASTCPGSRSGSLEIVDVLTPNLIIMPMQGESLEVLDKADVPPAQARAIVRAIEIEIAGARDTLATKNEILLLRQGLHQEMSELRSELKIEIHGSASSITRQMYVALLGQMAVLLGIAYFFVTHVSV
jgi:hypothetical protein